MPWSRLALEGVLSGRGVHDEGLLELVGHLGNLTDDRVEQPHGAQQHRRDLGHRDRDDAGRPGQVTDGLPLGPIQRNPWMGGAPRPVQR